MVLLQSFEINLSLIAFSSNLHFVSFSRARGVRVVCLLSSQPSC